MNLSLFGVSFLLFHWYNECQATTHDHNRGKTTLSERKQTQANGIISRQQVDIKPPPGQCTAITVFMCETTLSSNGQL